MRDSQLDLDDDEPTEKPFETESGLRFDANNISGKAKLKLIMEGEASLEDFTTPDNMPGKELRELRARRSGGVEAALDRKAQETKNTFKLGDIVQYKEWRSEVIEVDPKRGVRIHKGNKPSKWIHHTKVVKAEG